MFFSKNKILYILFFSIVFLFSIYSIILYGQYNPMFYTNNALFLSYIKTMVLPYATLVLPEQFMVFPDMAILTIVGAFTVGILQHTVAYIIFTICILYMLLIYTSEKFVDTSGTVTFSVILLAVLLSSILTGGEVFSFFFVPNGYIGFFIAYCIIARAMYLAYFEKEISFAIWLFAIMLFLLTYSAPILTLVYIVLPLLCSNILHMRMQYTRAPHKILLLVIILVYTLGFIVQYYMYPLKIYTVRNNVDIIFSQLYTENMLLFILGCIGVLYLCCRALLYHRQSLYIIFFSRMILIGSFCSAIAVSVGILSLQDFYIILFFMGLFYGFPQFVMSCTTLVAVQFSSLVYTGILAVSLFLIFFLHWNVFVLPEEEYVNPLITCIEKSLGNSNKEYILAPYSISAQVATLTQRKPNVIPYNPKTLFQSEYIKNTSLNSITYSMIIVDASMRASTMMDAILALIGAPTETKECSAYSILLYPKGVTMPDEATLATYTTQVGNIVRKNIENAISIPMPKLFSLYGSPVNAIKLIHTSDGTFLALVFPKGAVLPKDGIYKVYTLSPHSSSYRKLFSGIRREIPSLGSILPLEDESTSDTKGGNNLYTLASEEQVVIVPLENNVKDSLIYLSIGVDTKQPIVLQEYPMAPIILKY